MKDGVRKPSLHLFCVVLLSLFNRKPTACPIAHSTLHVNGHLPQAWCIITLVQTLDREAAADASLAADEEKFVAAENAVFVL